MNDTRPDPARTAPRSPADPLHDLHRLGAYRVLRRLGEGGMGAVYLACDEVQRRQVALKVLGDHLADDQTYVDRFYREAKSGALLDHPNIVHTFSVGQDQATGKHYLVQEFVDGPSVHALLTRLGRLPVGAAVRIALDVARALAHAHSRNIVHRDVKPDNILLTRSGVAKLVDLGLSRRTDETSHLTTARQGFGTTHYMPCEQATSARRADGRSDVYALGATFYHLLTGAVPFPGRSHLEVMERKCRGDFAPATSVRPDVPAVLDSILGRMLARDPRDRYQTAAEVVLALERSGLATALPDLPDLAQSPEDSAQQTPLLGQTGPTRLDPARSEVRG